MKKLFVLAMVATLLTAGSAFATQRHFGATPNATFSTAIGQGPTTTNNDDSCDISVAPAATLLLPYFEVDVTGPGRETTLFTVTNTSPFPQIAHVTVWTQYSVPVLDFNLFLTGYDVQGINLYDVIVNGTVAGTGTSNQEDTGSLSMDNDANPNFGTGAATSCALLPGQLPPSVVTQVRTALTTGAYTGTGCTAAGSVGGNHPTLAEGYVTVDVANTCSTKLPTDSSYYTTEILFDNVLIGDYQQLGSAPVGQTATGFDGQSNPMVHIRAIPEGGPAGQLGVTTNLPFTYYDRYTPTATPEIDRRQPLPAVFAARYIESTSAGFATNFQIWREGTAFHPGTSCSAIVAGGSNIPITDIVRFDEHENPFGVAGSTICSPCSSTPVGLPESSSVASSSSVFPANGSSDLGGWMYMNLNSATFTGSVTRNGGPYASQNWVTVSMYGSVGANRLGASFDAAWLYNGCSAAVGVSTENNGSAIIGPNQGGLVCPAGATCNGTYTGTNATP